jgi:hypothetical protein
MNKLRGGLRYLVGIYFCIWSFSLKSDGLASFYAFAIGLSFIVPSGWVWRLAGSPRLDAAGSRTARIFRIARHFIGVLSCLSVLYGRLDKDLSAPGPALFIIGLVMISPLDFLLFQPLDYRAQRLILLLRNAGILVYFFACSPWITFRSPLTQISLLAVGGGLLLVPALMARKRSLQRAEAE